MSKFVIRSKDSLAHLELLLKEFGLEYEQKSSKLLFVPFSTTKEDKMLVDISLSVFLAHDFINKITNEYLKKHVGELNQEKADFIKQKMDEMFVQVDYYRHLTVLLVAEHLEKSNELFVDAFQKFVMRGFKEDVENSIESLLAELNAVEKKADSMQYLKNFSNRLMEKNKDYIHYKKAYVEMNDGVMSIFLENEQTNKKVLLDMELVKQLLGEEVSMKLTEVDAENEWLNEVAWLSMVVVLLPIEEIIVHLSVSIEAIPYIFSLAETIEVKDVLVHFCSEECSVCHP